MKTVSFEKGKRVVSEKGIEPKVKKAAQRL